ncbi:probable proteasome inhibitor [Magnolia sinica]|uniref:probable proteasome inhibitor n=1 Tax=Magnolia sinica TaxID=86752 RepID=UPI00265A021D|nr:probable proteasome inhibitor [Magnolia sinica]
MKSKEMGTATSVMVVIRASRPSFRKPHDKIAFAVHASFLSSGYTLIATGTSAFSHPTTPPSSEQGEVGIDGWNELDDCYGFIYTKTEKGTKISVLVKCLVIGDKLVIDALPLEDDQKEPYKLRIKVKDYVSDEGNRPTNYSKMYKNFPALVEKLQSDLLDKLENNLKSKCSTPSTSRWVATQKGKGLDRSPNQPGVGVFPEDRPYSSGIKYPPVSLPTVIDDLHPGPGAGFYRTRGGSGFGGGMLMGPNDPRWGGIGGEQPGGGLDPGIPPGSHFDPYGPPGVPGFEPSRFVRNPRCPGGGTHLDLEHFGSSDLFRCTAFSPNMHPRRL